MNPTRANRTLDQFRESPETQKSDRNLAPIAHRLAAAHTNAYMVLPMVLPIERSSYVVQNRVTFQPKYFISPEWARRGMPKFYEDIFKDSCEKGCLTFRATKAKSDRNLA